MGIAGFLAAVAMSDPSIKVALLEHLVGLEFKAIIFYSMLGYVF